MRLVRIARRSHTEGFLKMRSHIRTHVHTMYQWVCLRIHTHTVCDPLWKNRLLAIFYDNRVLGIDRCRIYCRVQRSKSQTLKSLLNRVIANKLYTGHPCLSSQIFEKRSGLYVHSSTFNVSVLHHAVSAIMNLPGKMATERASVRQSWSVGEDIERSDGLYT